jgi:hypothetical protein
MTDVKITFIHKCEKFNREEGYELKNLAEEWAIVEDLGDTGIEILGNINYCPYCGKKLEVPAFMEGCEQV